jgi:Na+/phosphate symporter
MWREYMQEQEYLQTLNKIFDAMISCLDLMAKSMATHDKKYVQLAEKEFITSATAGLPLADRLTSQADKDELEKKFLTLLPTLQRAGLAMDDLLSRIRRQIDGGILFTDKANAEITDIMRRVRDLVRDTKDYYATKNPTLFETGKADFEKLVDLVHQYAEGHLQRMITGLCTPQSSYVYVDMIESLKRMATQLASLAKKV